MEMTVTKKFTSRAVTPTCARCGAAANTCVRCGTQLRKVLRRDEVIEHVRRALRAIRQPDLDPCPGEDPLRFQTRRARELFERMTHDAAPSLETIDAAERSLCACCYAGGAR